VSAAPIEDATLRLGLLMEAAQSQQALAASSLERLREHAAGLDAIVREELRSTLIEELQALTEETHRAARALQELRRAANLRLLLTSVAVAGVASAVPLGLASWLLPTRQDIALLRSTRDELAANVARLSERGGRIELRRCGAAQRLCVRIDRTAPAYGDGADYLVVRGY
jgi:hypothetical protein